jgi:haloalkane dehalogenase
MEEETMPIIRTPEERFSHLVDFPFSPRYVEVNSLRIHYIDEGEGELILCLHGEPTWSYLYRKMIPVLSAKHRVLAMDFVGFGRSDKYSEREEYSYEMHHDTLTGFIKALDLDGITLVVQDWGGLIGLTVASEMPEKFKRLVIMNTFLPTGEEPLGKAFHKWREFVNKVSQLQIGRVIGSGLADRERMTPEAKAAYDAPFPDASYKVGARMWPLLVPVQPEDPGAKEMKNARKVLSKWEKPVAVMFSDKDPITRAGYDFFLNLIPSVSESDGILIEDAGHFLQEEKGEEIAEHILRFISRTTVS